MSLAATLLYADAQCRGPPARADFILPNNANTGCVSSAVASKCSVSATSNGFQTSTICVEPATQFKFNPWSNSSVVVRVFKSENGADCSSTVQVGFAQPVDACAPSNGVFTRLTIDPISRELYSATYSDSACTALTSVKTYDTSVACNAGISISLANYNGFSEVTSYTGSDCSTPRSYRSSDGEYETRVCSTNQTDIVTRPSAVFKNASYFTLQEFTDAKCSLPKSSAMLVLGTCFPTTTSLDRSIQSASSSLSADGSAVRVSYFATPDCQGTESGPSTSFPTDGTCTFGTKVVLGSPSLRPAPSVTAVPVAGIAGGSTPVDSEKLISSAASMAGEETSSVVSIADSQSSSRVPWWEKKQPTRSLLATGEDEEVSSVAESTGSGSKRLVVVSRMTMGGSKKRGADSEVQRKITDKEQLRAMFGDLSLPALPSQWTSQDVVVWCFKNDGTPGLLKYIKGQNIDGRALLELTEDQLAKVKIGNRAKFWEKLNELKRVNSSILAAESVSDVQPDA
ncbi:hypothetical protein BCR33DRAFT_851766 [Rhizoclosmatium globosum]|uniref:Uncharacterized protein n=1 Tax=Rhizoclosmatium globosum TaxID=329046 RepID=A0A1Y2C5T6_9FUNG|nr:hypothetical protein BCR33DRAFT_851766 [Rhizoclosmatium globosum]|eukprot:ORY42244.1 hypothetical protein BCR33DRAFT_851766 [Rhizoclosmatium globosum]